MKELHKTLDMLMKQSDIDDMIIKSWQTEKTVYPFSMENRIMAYLLSSGTITYEQYLQLSHAYCQRNQYLDLFDMASRTFGETWGEQHILSLFPEFQKIQVSQIIR